jgi:hypothetical protein
LVNVGFQVGDIQGLLFGCELEVFKVHDPEKSTNQNLLSSRFRQ